MLKLLLYEKVSTQCVSLSQDVTIIEQPPLSAKEKHIQSVKPLWKDHIFRVCRGYNSSKNTTKHTLTKGGKLTLTNICWQFRDVIIYVGCWFCRFLTYDLRLCVYYSIQMLEISQSIWWNYKGCSQEVPPFPYCTSKYIIDIILKVYFWTSPPREPNSVRWWSLCFVCLHMNV